MSRLIRKIPKGEAFRVGEAIIRVEQVADKVTGRERQRVVVEAPEHVQVVFADSKKEPPCSSAPSRV